MSGIPISQLDFVASVLGTEKIPIVQNGVTSSVSPALLGSFINAGLVGNYTSNHIITTDQNLGTFTNAGASGSVTFTMPTPSVGLQFTFVVAAAQSLGIDVNGSVVVALGQITSSAGGFVSANSPYSALTLKALSATLWAAVAMIGSWTPA